MFDGGIKICRVGMPEGLIGLAEGVGHGGADIEFDNFHRLVNKIPQSAVELISLTDLPECGARLEMMALGFEGQAVATEAVVVEVAQEIFRFRAVLNFQASVG